jgi:hypothetical protein
LLFVNFVGPPMNQSQLTKYVKPWQAKEEGQVDSWTVCVKEEVCRDNNRYNGLLCIRPCCDFFKIILLKRCTNMNIKIWKHIILI